MRTAQENSVRSLRRGCLLRESSLLEVPLYIVYKFSILTAQLKTQGRSWNFEWFVTNFLAVKIEHSV